MKEIIMQSLTEITKKVCEQGEVKSTGGVSVASRHAINVIKAVDHLIKSAKKQSQTTLITNANNPMLECVKAVKELLNANEGDVISEKTRELLGSSAAEILEGEAKMTSATRAVVNDIVLLPLTHAEDIMPALKLSHYEAQFDKKAKAEGANFSFRGSATLVSRPG